MENDEIPDQDDPSAGEDIEGNDDAPPKRKSQTSVEELARRRVQSVLDESMGLMRQGRFNEIKEPKIVQMLTEFNNTINGGNLDSRQEDEDDSSSIFFPRSDSSRKPNKLEKLGQQALMKEQMTKLMTAAEENVINELWPVDIKTFFTEFAKAPITDEQFKAVDPLDERQFPRNKQGYAAWRAASQKLGAELRRSQIEEGDTESVTGVDADRKRAIATRRMPNIQGTGGGGSLDATTMAQRFKAGKVTKDKAREFVKANMPGTS